MKRILLVTLIILCLFPFWDKVIGQDAHSDFKKLDWIAGTWKRTNPDEGQNGYERWTKLSDTTWQGVGIAMRGKDSSFVEKLKMIIKNNHIYYIADVAGNPEPVWYRFTNITDDGFSCENLEYDFPKKIEYRRNGKRIKATISGDGKFIDYLFKKQRN